MNSDQIVSFRTTCTKQACTTGDDSRVCAIEPHQASSYGRLRLRLDELIRSRRTNPPPLLRAAVLLSAACHWCPPSALTRSGALHFLYAVQESGTTAEVCPAPCRRQDLSADIRRMESRDGREEAAWARCEEKDARGPQTQTNAALSLRPSLFIRGSTVFSMRARNHGATAGKLQVTRRPRMRDEPHL